jgi:Uma2 family endonuclease
MSYAQLEIYEPKPVLPSISLKTKTIPKGKPDRPAWIPAHITENWDPEPFAYQTEEELMPAGGLHGQLLTYVAEVVRVPLEKQQLMLLVDTFLLYRDSRHTKKRVAPDLLLMEHSFPAPSAYDLDMRPPPSLMIETTSPKSHLKDLQDNVPFYFNLGVETYLVIDAITPQKTLRSPIELHLWQKTKGKPYQKVGPDNAGFFLLPQMNIKIKAQEQRLIFVDALTGKLLRDSGQLSEALQEAETRAEMEAQRAEAAENRAQTAFSDGEQKGEQKGRLTEKQEIARKMLSKGFDLTEITELTDISPNELATLSKP